VSSSADAVWPQSLKNPARRSGLLADPLLHREPAGEQPHQPGQLGQAQDVLVRDVPQTAAITPG
jgi:hypothetical protein